MDNQVFYQVVVPTLITGAAFIGITTLGIEVNFVDELIHLKRADGKELFNTIAIDMVCADCKREGLEKTCEHLLGEMPHWQDSSRQADIELMMSGQENLFMLENRGIRAEGQMQPFFNQDSVRDLSEKPHYRPKSDSKIVHITIDPSAGGEGSMYAINSCIYDDHRIIIIGAESGEKTAPEYITNLIVEHIKKIRTIPGIETAFIAIHPEGNLGNEAGWIDWELKRITRLKGFEVIYEDKGKAGFRTTNQSKSEMAHLLRLKLEEKCVFFHDKFFSIGDGTYKDNSITTSLMKREIIQQLFNYSRSVKVTSGSDKKVEIFSGKEAGNGLDDQAIAFQANVYLVTKSKSKNI